MDNKKKILLGDADIISKSNEDLFINLNLNNTFSEIRADKFENVFDISQQFNKERNSSRDFRIYGIIDSTVADCDNAVLAFFSMSGVPGGVGTLQLGSLIQTITATPLVYDNKNVYSKKRGKYLVELSGYTNDFIYITVANPLVPVQTYVQQLIFRDTSGNFIDYGTQTIEVDENGNAFNINNDFYFLFNKHWVKKDLPLSSV